MEAVENWHSYERVEEIRAYLEKQKEQKPAEWSEEDEKMYETFMHKLEVCDLLTNKENIWAIRRLKSIRPQPHWKPSEEQMEWIECAMIHSREMPRIHPIIVSLYEQLKKL